MSAIVFVYCESTSQLHMSGHSQQEACDTSHNTLQARAKRQSSPHLITNKKDEDNEFDIEAAVLTGGGAGGFQPLAGLVRGAPAPFNNRLVVRGAHQLDRVFVGLDQRPLARAATMIYMIVLHLVAVFV